MKWTVMNAFGGLSWLAGLQCAKGASFPIENLFSVGDEHRVLFGTMLGLAGLLTLIWANVRSPV